MKKVLLSLLCMFSLSACLEVKSADDAQPALVNESGPLTEEPPLVEETRELVRMETDEALYFWDGEFFNSTDWESKKAQNPEPQKMDYKVVVDEVVFGPNAVIYTNGFNVRFKIGKLISHDATVATFPAGQTAPAGTNGRNGGSIQIQLENAEGHLNVVLRGEIGSVGPTGPAPDKYNTGKDGVAARYSNGNCIFDSTVRQTSPPVHPEPGKKGYTGLTGFRGGDSGSVLIIMPKGLDFTFLPERYVGFGGKGGPGGEGGPGGYMPPDYCLGKMPPGEAGPVGDEGPEGVDGSKGDICERIGGGELCY